MSSDAVRDAIFSNASGEFDSGLGLGAVKLRKIASNDPRKWGTMARDYRRKWAAPVESTLQVRRYPNQSGTQTGPTPGAPLMSEGSGTNGE